MATGGASGTVVWSAAMPSWYAGVCCYIILLISSYIPDSTKAETWPPCEFHHVIGHLSCTIYHLKSLLIHLQEHTNNGSSTVITNKTAHFYEYHPTTVDLSIDIVTESQGQNGPKHPKTNVFPAKRSMNIKQQSASSLLWLDPSITITWIQWGLGPPDFQGPIQIPQ